MTLGQPVAVAADELQGVVVQDPLHTGKNRCCLCGGNGKCRLADHGFQQIAGNRDRFILFNFGQKRIFLRIQAHHLDLRRAGADYCLELLGNFNLDVVGRQLADHFHEKFGWKDNTALLSQTDDFLAFLFHGNEGLDGNIRIAGGKGQSGKGRIKLNAAKNRQRGAAGYGLGHMLNGFVQKIFVYR
ncbi:hypothetical protein D3C76_1080610 [compost metagenome]